MQPDSTPADQDDNTPAPPSHNRRFSYHQDDGEGIIVVTVRGLIIIGVSLLLLTGCTVPDGYSVDTLNQQPEAGVTYPGSTDVHTDNYNGSPGSWIGKGGVARAGKTGIPTHTRSEVVAYYSQELAADGWTQTMDNPADTLASGLPTHVTAWEKAKLNLTYEFNVWVDAETTKYFIHVATVVVSSVVGH